jgi:hypothetical protein
MTPSALARRIRKLRPRLPRTIQFERALAKRGIWSTDGVWYKSQQQHWLGWLGEYNGPGYYGRKNSHRSAEFAYNHIVCPPMVLWLGEATGIPKATVAKAMRAGLAAGRSLASQSAAIRQVIPWDAIQNQLEKHKGSAKRLQTK